MDEKTSDLLTPDRRREMRQRLLRWFASHARDLPWRQNRTPYRVWVSEVMLQQTQVDTVIPYFEDFLERFPDVEALARADLEEVLKVWEGLGYYARARRLHEAARQLASRNQGQVPAHFRALKALPGVGAYTAGAVASIAFGEGVPAVDGNARRVLCRVLGIWDDVTRSANKRELDRLAGSLVPRHEPGAFNEALIELGATVCTPRGPSCDECPLGAMCWARANDEQEALPVKRPRRKPPHYDVAAAVTTAADGTVLVAKRRADDMLGGLWEFPGGKCEDSENLRECLVREMEEELGVTVKVGRLLTTVDHAYTHLRITLHAYWCRLAEGEPACLDCAALQWVLPARMDELPMSVVDRKVAEAVKVKMGQPSAD